VTITTRLSLHKPDLASEAFGDYFITAYAADLQQIDDQVQIKNLAAAGKMPVYDANGFLVSSGIEPADVPTGIDSILTDQGMLLYKNATALAALSPSTAGKSLMTQGVGADPVFGYPAHGTLTGLTTGDPHTQYHTDARGDARYAPIAKGVTGGDAHNALHDSAYAALAHASRHRSGGADAIKLDDLAAPDNNTDLDVSTSAHGLMPKLPNTKQAFLGDKSWRTITWGVDFEFGDGSAVLTDQAKTSRCGVNACKITKAYIRSIDTAGALKTGSVTCSVHVHNYNAAIGSAVDTFSLAAASTYSETGLSIAVAADKYVTVVLTGISTVTQIVLSLEFEAT